MIGDNKYHLPGCSDLVESSGRILRALRSKDFRLNPAISESNTILGPRDQRGLRFGVDVGKRRWRYKRSARGASGKYRNGESFCLDHGIAIELICHSPHGHDCAPAERDFRRQVRWCTIGAQMVHKASGTVNERMRDHINRSIRNRNLNNSLHTGWKQSFGAMTNGKVGVQRVPASPILDLPK